MRAAETDPVFLHRFSRPALRALRPGLTTELARQQSADLSVMGRALQLYFGGDMEASIALTGQVAGRIEAVLPVDEILRTTVEEFRAVAARVGAFA